MLIYYSRFKNTEKMLKKLDMNIPKANINDYDGVSKYVLVTPTYGFGEVPQEVKIFLERHYKNMTAVISSGNRNWGTAFANAGEIISKDYNVPLLMKYELTGMNDDIKNLRRVIGEHYGTY